LGVLSGKIRLVYSQREF